LAGKGRVIDAKGKEIAKWVTFFKDFLLSINNYKLLLMVNYIMQPSVFWSKQAVVESGFLNGFGKIVMEYDYWLRLGKVRMPAIIPKSLSKFRLSGNNFSVSDFKSILSQDFNITRKYTTNELILLIHRLYNYLRILTLKFI
jgi:hypothetical protein